MNRTFKFRAWDKREGKMWTPIIDKDGTPCAKHPVTMHMVRMDGELLDPVMQFTGLTDRNGVEIYESDVVRCIDGHVGVVEWEEHDCTFNVSEYYCPSNDYPTMAFIEGQPLEVIGNVYESPELLDQTNG